MNGDYILAVEGLCKAFGGLQATSEVTYSMRPGELSAIIGPNGAGKSTFFNLITGFHRPDKGKVLFKGADVTSWSSYRIARFGMSRAFQVSNIYPMLTTYQNVRQAILVQQRRTMDLFRRAEHLARKETTELLEVTGLGEHHQEMAGTMSQGDKKRLELALALAIKPDLLLLDEPTAGMSVEETHETMELVARLNREMGVTILFTEHDMSVVFGYARRLTVLHQGALIADGAPQDVRADEEVQRVYLGEEV
ncbi:MAG: ABC transporter ATP-binding protein [Proteobacteria bacterium]|nr:ABC transporter ATP-binding protein [Pseudomonadota bacterium]MBU4599528.1 ABC transporter ATP-binding protein [Pseudomonadota bacterium]